MKKVMIYGAGIFGKMLNETFRENGVNVVCFVDSYSNEKSINNIPIYRVENVEDDWKNFDVYITATKQKYKIIEALKEQGINNIFNLSQSFKAMKYEFIPHKMVEDYYYKAFTQYGHDVNKAIQNEGFAKIEEQNKDKITKIFALLSDEKSVKTLKDVLNYKRSGGDKVFSRLESNTIFSKRY